MNRSVDGINAVVMTGSVRARHLQHGPMTGTFDTDAHAIPVRPRTDRSAHGRLLFQVGSPWV